MRTLYYVLVLALSMTPLLSAQESAPVFMVSLKEDLHPKATTPDWQVDVGEVYQFVRNAAPGESPDSQPDYIVVRVGDVSVMARRQDFAQVPEKDVAQAAMRYNDEVAQARRDAQESTASPQFTHQRFANPDTERRFIEIAKELRDKGIEPSNDHIMPILNKELEEKAEREAAARAQSAAAAQSQDEARSQRNRADQLQDQIDNAKRAQDTR